MALSRIIARHPVRLSPWVTLVAREIDVLGAAPETYHGLEVADYVTVLAVTADGRVPLVRQFRPAVEKFTIELPGGLAEPNEPPEVTAARELYEEVGLAAPGGLRLMGRLETDAGRLNNTIWCYFARDVVGDHDGWTAEPGLEILYWTMQELKDAVRDGRFTHAPHVAPIGLAILQGLV
jgi:ADP-ribose pyrophosphatase